MCDFASVTTFTRVIVEPSAETDFTKLHGPAFGDIQTWPPSLFRQCKVSKAPAGVVTDSLPIFSAPSVKSAFAAAAAAPPRACHHLHHLTGNFHRTAARPAE